MSNRESRVVPSADLLRAELPRRYPELTVAAVDRILRSTLQQERG